MMGSKKDGQSGFVLLVWGVVALVVGGLFAGVYFSFVESAEPSPYVQYRNEKKDGGEASVPLRKAPGDKGPPPSFFSDPPLAAEPPAVSKRARKREVSGFKGGDWVAIGVTGEVRQVEIIKDGGPLGFILPIARVETENAILFVVGYPSLFKGTPAEVRKLEEEGAYELCQGESCYEIVGRP